MIQAVVNSNPNHMAKIHNEMIPEAVLLVNFMFGSYTPII